MLRGLYLILDPSVCPARPLTDILREAATQGVRLFQYRDKEATMKDAYQCARELRQVAAEMKSLFIVNDRCDLALAVNADGVHLGQDDLPLTYARTLLGPDKIIGLSTHSITQVQAADRAKPDYVGFGPVFNTSTKADHDPVVGLRELMAARALTALPMFAIGGITAETAPDVMAAGADGVAVISAILKASDPRSAIRSFQQSLSTRHPPDP